MKTFLIATIAFLLGVIVFGGYSQYQKSQLLKNTTANTQQNNFDPINTQKPVVNDISTNVVKEEVKKVEEKVVVKASSTQSYPNLGFSVDVDKEKFNLKEDIRSLSSWGGNGYIFGLTFSTILVFNGGGAKNITIRGLTKNFKFGTLAMGGPNYCDPAVYLHNPVGFEMFTNKYGILFSVNDGQLVNQTHNNEPSSCAGNNFFALTQGGTSKIDVMEVSAEKPIFTNMTEFKNFLNTIKPI